MEKKIGHPRVSPRFEWLFVLFTFMQTAGVFVDGWAHGHINQLDTFFTPWHALFYGGFIFSSGLLFIELLKNHRNGYPWRRALPREYFFALGGVVIFGLGGMGDLIWHTLFGIEAGVDALLSPTHMALAFGGAVMASAPLHAIWYRDTNVHRILKLPVIISFALFFMVFTFMMQFFHPFYLPLWMSNLPDVNILSELQQTFHRELGIANSIIYTGMFMGLLLSTIRSWKFPFGSFSIILGLNALAIVLMVGDFYQFITTGFVAGFLVDIIYYKLFHNILKPHVIRVFGFLVPAAIFSSYVVTVLITNGTWWSIHLVAGYIVIAGIAGVMMTYLVVPPGDQRIQ
ncbi:hypothetical protein A2W67_01860 [Candidatus Nomurabacteria bacterium RIFCSPLOWO2_02_40_28]|uniref:Uncharacterized protein n=2 Tax=Candidatus Nomuraibacteriota TaxID=1752729 RepID=A0A837HRM3_9BACT|nr:MAG: hypothetical protein UT27_C0005G0022 [Candidatus Nomurabacteria bacterium GW2011_GWD2_39_12]KKR20288.1 MAG: hypothetical protein UT51_C0005G0021 [Candidatus Nomurabacteria bacterium GW2011_GWC2_39_41]KKR36534.1 MAG: hypothetical protein UT70_C0010G0021 [Candidatus Nomurabacteria bacterium GW2011_GWE2_40_10]KKR38381.1 MAG: hypothetical protein UT73_C0003G0021 [Candidatus Nomurabacteria bacterium GW2011_GWB1_40_11]KKR39880.1 MAG: hypothetical protein UT74_C0005G0097 [Parcubacteria group b